MKNTKNLPNLPYKRWFNTGVKPENRIGVSLSEFQAWINGTLQIAYYLESIPPSNAILEWLGNDNKVNNNQVAIKIVGGGMLSEYAIFKIVEKK